MTVAIKVTIPNNAVPVVLHLLSFIILLTLALFWATGPESGVKLP